MVRRQRHDLHQRSATAPALAVRGIELGPLSELGGLGEHVNRISEGELMTIVIDSVDSCPGAIEVLREQVGAFVDLMSEWPSDVVTCAFGELPPGLSTEIFAFNLVYGPGAALDDTLQGRHSAAIANCMIPTIEQQLAEFGVPADFAQCILHHQGATTAAGARCSALLPDASPSGEVRPGAGWSAYETAVAIELQAAFAESLGVAGGRVHGRIVGRRDRPRPPLRR